MLLPLLLLLVGFAVIIVMAATQSDEEGHPAYINILGVVGFMIPWILALVLLIKLYGKGMIVSILSKELKDLKRSKDYYFGLITADSPKKYLDTIAEDLTSARYKDCSAEVNLPYDNYKLLLRKHFWTLDSTNIHVHLATIDSDNFKIREFFNDITNKETELNYGKFKGNYCGIVAVCFVDKLKEDEQFLAFFNDVIFARGIAVIKVLIDVTQNRVFISSGGALTGNRGRRIVKRFILRTKSLKKHPGHFGKNNEKIQELEEKLDNLDFNNLFKDAELTDEEKAFTDSLSDGEVGFQGNETAEEGGVIFYKESNKILYLFCDYDENDKTFGIIGIKKLQWSIPKKVRISRKKKQKITKKIVQYLIDNDIPYAFMEMFFSKENQTILVRRVKK